MYERTTQKINQLINDGVFPGASFSYITKAGSADYTIGYAQLLPKREPMWATLLFDVASLTKVICTTTVVLQLVEAGVIDLDTPIKTYDSAFKDEKITTRQLLTHTADIQSYIAHRDQLTKEELRNAYYQVQSGENLGKKVVYTDTGMILLGFLLETICQKSVIDIFKERVLRPIGMWESTFLPKNPAQTVPTENHPVRGLIRGQTHDPKAFVLAEHAGNAGLFTNVADVKKFVYMYINEGKCQNRVILSPQTIRNLVMNQTLQQKGHRSLGWDLKESGNHAMLFHTGYTGTFLCIDPIDKEGMIFLSNRVHPVDKKEAYLLKREELIQVYLDEKNNK